MKVLPSTDFHIVILTVTEEITGKYFAKTTTTVPMFYKARTKYHCVPTVNDDEIKIFLVHCKQYHMEVLPRQNIQAEVFWQKILLAFFGSRRLSYDSAFRHNLRMLRWHSHEFNRSKLGSYRLN